MRKYAGTGLFTWMLLCSMLFVIAGGLIQPRSAQAASIHPLLDDYSNMKASYPFIGNLLAHGASDAQIQSWLGEVENYLSPEIVNQNSVFDSSKLSDIADHTFGDILANVNVKPPDVTATQNQEVFNALKAAYGQKIYDCIIGGQALPFEVQSFMSRIKDLLIRSMVVASPSPGTYNAPLTVNLSGFTSGAAFYYTLNGKVPTTQSTPYSGGITINTTGPVTVKAIACKNGIISDVNALSYNISEGSVTGGGGGALPATQALEVRTASWGSIDSAYATLYGSVPSNGSGQPLTEYGFFYSTAALSDQNIGTKVVAGTGDRTAPFDFNGRLDSLKPDTTYYFEAYAVTAQGTVHGDLLNFKTPSPPPVQPPSRQFPDVPDGYWAKDQIGQMAQDGFIAGYPDGNFYPDLEITRAELARVITLALSITDRHPGKPTFGDVNQSDWFYGSVEAAVYTGLVKGRSSVAFDPNAPITREELAVIVVSALGKVDEAGSKMNVHTGFVDDSAISDWARGFVEIASQTGLISGYPDDNSFKPQRGATRAEVCAILNKMLSLK